MGSTSGRKEKAILADADWSRLRALVVQRVSGLFPELQRLRRDFHQYPELANQEERTGRVIGDYLSALGLEVRRGVAGHGVVADLSGGRPGLTLAYRADMDALPIQEPPGCPWASRHPGVMHACGHDLHLAIALGAARLLAELRQEWAGRLRFIFQPAEEGLPPGTLGGAALMLQEGVLQQPPVAAIFGLHVAPRLPVGRLGYCPEVAMAGAETLRLTIRGRQAHAATPQHGVDAILLAAQAVTLIPALLSQGKDARAPAVLTFGTIAGGSRANILADQVVLEGTLRYFEPRVRETLLQQLRRLLSGLTAAAGANYDLLSAALYPVLKNDPRLAQRALAIWRTHFAPADLVEVRPVLGSEDFAFFAQQVPGFYFFLGTQKPGQPGQNLHAPDFDPDEGALAVGLLAAVLLLLGFSREEA